VSKVELAAPRHHLNTLSIKATMPSDTAPPPAVVLHGYGAGLGFFFRNFPALAQVSSQHKLVPQMLTFSQK
jgi:cardiolipin-specific phospholipase